MKAFTAPRILVTDSSSGENSRVAKQLEAVLAEKHFDFVRTSEESLMERFDAGPGGALPEAICMPAAAKWLPPVLRALQAKNADCHIFLAHAGNLEDDLKRKLQLLPLNGLSWSTLDLADEDLSQQLAGACEQVQTQRGYTAVIGRANRELSNKATRFHAPSASGYYLEHFLAYSRDAIVAVDQNEKIVLWSAGAEYLFGIGSQAAVGTPIRKFPFWSSKLCDLLDGGESSTGPVLIDSEFEVSGRKVAIETLCSAVRDDTGNYVGMSLVCRDVSERQKAANAERDRHINDLVLAEKERQRLRALFEQAPGFIAVTSGPDHVFTIANNAYLQVIGNRKVIGKPASQALPDLRGQEFLNLLDHVYEARKPFMGRAMPVKVVHDDEYDTRYVDFVFQPILEEGGSVSGVFCQGTDVTEHKKTQARLDDHLQNLEQLVEKRTAELKASQEALFASQKLEAIGKLTGGVAHDFNNVLQIIAGNLELLELQNTGANDRTKSQNYLSAALDAVTRGKNLSAQLLAFARRQPLRPVPTHLGKLLRNMDHLLRRALGETIEIETVVAGGLWNTNIDPHQLENVILNLALNAKDAMPNGGKLTLEVGNALLDDHYIASQPDVPPGQYVLIAVSDTGSGMSQEVLDHAFEPFFTTKKEGEGTGLGLSMAYGFTKQSGGHIRIYSELGNGTTFKIYLPRTFDRAVEAPRSGSVVLTGGAETILVVEDDIAVRTTAVLILEDLGYSVLQAEDGQSALTVLQSGVKIDLLFSDVVMPGPIRSPEVARRAKALFPHIQVLFTSGYTQNAIVHGGRLDPGVELLSKPYRREDLAKKVRQLLDRTHQAPDESIEAKPKPEPNPEPNPSMRILLVEDDADSRSATQELLTVLGHSVSVASSAEEALEALAEAFDILITDLRLPCMSGQQLVEEAVKTHPDLRVIIASGISTEFESHAVKEVVQLVKPFDLKALRDAIHRAIR